MKKQVFHINDKIVIKNPLFFVRCGYPFNRQYAKDNLVTAHEKELINQLVGRDPFGTGYLETAHDKILDVVAYIKLIQSNFGGPERKVFTKEIPELLGKEATVFNKKYVKTGIRDDGYQSGENEWQPTVLKNEKTHVLLLLGGLPMWPEDELLGFKSDALWDHNYWIEEIHVEKIK